MDARLVFLAAVTSVGLARPVRADTAADHLKRGADLYKTGKYADAISELTKAYELEPRPETLFPLAQAERLNGDCKSAAAHYKTILTQIADVAVARVVQQNLELCEKREDTAGQACVASPAQPEKKPDVTPATVTKVESRDRTDAVGIGLVGGGALAFGVATGLYFASVATRDAADRADSLDSHDELAKQSDRQRIGMIVAVGLGTVALGVAGVRWVLRRKEAHAEVVVVPTSEGVGVWAAGRF